MGGEDALHGAAPAVDSEVSVADSGASEEAPSAEAAHQDPGDVSEDP